MAKIVECIPNFSEGRNQAVDQRISSYTKSIPGVTLLDYSSDARQTTTVASLHSLGMKKAFDQIGEIRFLKTLTDEHEGEHMGATDVCPFVPVKDITTAECVRWLIKWLNA